jgi:hypothetical protein
MENLSNQPEQLIVANNIYNFANGSNNGQRNDTAVNGNNTIEDSEQGGNVTPFVDNGNGEEKVDAEVVIYSFSRILLVNM